MNSHQETIDHVLQSECLKNGYRCKYLAGAHFNYHQLRMIRVISSSVAKHLLSKGLLIYGLDLSGAVCRSLSQCGVIRQNIMLKPNSSTAVYRIAVPVMLLRSGVFGAPVAA